LFQVNRGFERQINFFCSLLLLIHKIILDSMQYGMNHYLFMYDK